MLVTLQSSFNEYPPRATIHTVWKHRFPQLCSHMCTHPHTHQPTFTHSLAQGEASRWLFLPAYQRVVVGCLAGRRLEAVGAALRVAHSLPLRRSQAQAGGVVGSALPSPSPLLWLPALRTGWATGLGCRPRSESPVSSFGQGAPCRPGCCSGCFMEELGEPSQGQASCVCAHVLMRYLRLWSGGRECVHGMGMSECSCSHSDADPEPVSMQMCECMPTGTHTRATATHGGLKAPRCHLLG